jgi:threonine/homoserine/homoserine lactone efflux protein
MIVAVFPLLTTFFIISLTGALAPGPLTTVAIVEGSRRGKWAGVSIAIGHGLVEAPYMALIAILIWVGQETILQQSLITGLIAIGGGGFLIWMGLRLFLDAWRENIQLTELAVQKPQLGLAPTGSLVTLSNPYWWIWWALITPLYIRDALAWGVIGVTILFFVHWSTDLGWLTTLSWLTGSGRGVVTPRLYRWVLIICGGALGFFGITFIIAGLRFIITGTVSLG